jgi:hypothetical protein
MLSKYRKLDVAGNKVAREGWETRVNSGGRA